MNIRTFLSASAAAIIVAAPVQAAARDVSFDISAGSLGPALNAFSRAASIELIADPALLQNRRTTGLRGRHQVARGLTQLLRGSGLSYQQRNGSYVIVAAPRGDGPKGTEIARAAAEPAATAAAEGDGPPIDIVVTGQRGANQDAIAIKRRERNVVDAVSSDEAQRLPDLTIVNAMRRIPGVSVLPVADNEHPRDEAIAPVLRGLNQSYNNVTVNGLPVASPGIPQSGTGAAGRGVRLDILPTSLVKQIVVVKTFTPDLDPNAVGGAVDLRTRSAFDGGGKPFFTAEAGLANTSQKGIPHPQDDFGKRFSATGSTTFGADHNLGIVVSGNYQRLQNYTEVHATSDSVYYNFYRDNGTRVTDGGLGNGWAVPQQDKSWYNESDRERWSLTGRLEGEFGNVSVFGMAGYYKFIDGYNRNELVINGRNISVSNQTETTGDYGSASVELGYRTGKTISETKLFQAGLDWRASDHDLVSIRGSLSKATSREPHDMVKYNGGINASGSTIGLPQFAFDYDTSNFHHSFNVDPDAYYDLSLYQPAYWRHRERRAGGKINSLRADWSHNLEGDAEGFGFGVGAAYSDTRADHNFYGDQYSTTDRSLNLAGIGSMSNAYLSFNNNGLRLITIDNDRAWQQFDDNQGSIRLDDSTNGNNQDNFVHKEELISGYAMAGFTTERFRLLAGVRAERTNIDTLSFVRVDGTWTPNPTDSDYSFLLPSVLGSYDISPALRVRAGFSQTIGRPSYEAYASRSSITFENNGDIGDPNAENVSVTLGNPDIKPRRSNNYDLSLEWTLSNRYGGLISAAAFHKDISDEIYLSRSNGYTYDGVNYVNASVVQPDNASNARISGIEFGAIVNSLEFVAPWLTNFGISANWSLLDGAIKVPQSVGGTRKIGRLFGQPDEIRNVQLFFEHKGFELRGAYSWTGRALRDVVQDVYWQDVYWAPRKQFDAQARYAIKPGLHVVAEVNNLTEERMDSVTGPKKNLLKDSYSTPRTIWLSLNWTPGR